MQREVEVIRCDEPSETTQGLVVHYGMDGVQPVMREFMAAADARVAFSRLVEFGSRLRSKGLSAMPNLGRPETVEAVVLYTRWKADVWVREGAKGAAVAVAALGRWVQLRQRRPLESRGRRLAAWWLGCLVRGVLYLWVQRLEPLLVPGLRVGVLGTRVLNAVLQVLWPNLRVMINEAVNARVPAIVNGAIAKLAKKPIERMSYLKLDIGCYAPEILSVAVSPSFAGSDYLDVDLDVRLRGDGVRLRVDVDVGGDDKPDATGEVGRGAVDGSVRLKLGPLITPLPCARRLEIGFSAKPRLDLRTHFRPHDSTGLGRAGVQFEAIDRFVNRLIENVVENLLCWPRHINVPLADLVLGPGALGDNNPPPPLVNKPIGTLRVEVLRCADLVNNDLGGLSDPYVVCKLGQTEAKTTTLTDTCDPVWPNPRTFVFDVHETSQLCAVSVYDSEADNFGAFNDALLGRATFRLSDLNIDHKAPAAELRLPLDTAVYDGKLRSIRDSPKTSAVFLLAKFTPEPDALNNTDPEARGLAPLAVALVLVAALAVLVDLLARPIILLVLSAILQFTVATIALFTFLSTLVLVLGAIV